MHPSFVRSGEAKRDATRAVPLMRREETAKWANSPLHITVSTFCNGRRIQRYATSLDPALHCILSRLAPLSSDYAAHVWYRFLEVHGLYNPAFRGTVAAALVRHGLSTALYHTEGKVKKKRDKVPVPVLNYLSTTPWRHTRMEEWVYRSIYSWPLHYMEGEWSASRSCRVTPGTHWIGGWVWGPRTGLDDERILWRYRNSNSDPSVVQPEHRECIFINCVAIVDVMQSHKLTSYRYFILTTRFCYSNQYINLDLRFLQGWLKNPVFWIVIPCSSETVHGTTQRIIL
jgi:hypothetical protein